MFEDRGGTLWVACLQRLWEWRDRPAEVKAAGRSLSVMRLVDVATARSVFAQLVVERQATATPKYANHVASDTNHVARNASRIKSQRHC